jgi:hypothetical protein
LPPLQPTIAAETPKISKIRMWLLDMFCPPSSWTMKQ